MTTKEFFAEILWYGGPYHGELKAVEGTELVVERFIPGKIGDITNRHQ